MAGSWFLAPSLVALREEANRRWPNRDRSSDGSVGDTSHAARRSDHNPDWSAPGGRAGIVRAYDLDEDLDGDGTDRGAELAWWVNHLVSSRDPRVAYVIYEGRIVSSTVAPWEWRPYSGVNAHRKHVHVSIRHTPAAENDIRPWFPQEDDLMPALTDTEQRELLRLLREVHAETADRDTGRLREVTVAGRQLLDARAPGYFAKPPEMSPDRPTVYYVDGAHQSKLLLDVGGPLHEHIKALHALAGLPQRAVIVAADVLDAIPTVND